MRLTRTDTAGNRCLFLSSASFGIDALHDVHGMVQHAQAIRCRASVMIKPAMVLMLGQGQDEGEH